MPDAATVNRVFISCVSDEFEKPGAPFPGLRGNLRHYLTRADCEVKVQEDFRQTGDVDTLQKLDGYIRRCAAVIHLVGEVPGALANQKAVRAYLAATPNFLEEHSELRVALLYLADVHLHRARLFAEKGSLQKARDLIEQHGYWRRKEELEDAEPVLGDR